MRIEIQLSTAARHIRSELMHSGAINGAVDRIMTNVLNGCVVLAPSLRPVGNSQAPGKFGSDEPHPRELLGLA